jgi:hypothetical protein
MKMQAVDEVLPLPRAATAAPSDAYSPEDPPEALTLRHPLGVEVLGLQETPRTAKDRIIDVRENCIVDSWNRVWS